MEDELRQRLQLLILMLEFITDNKRTTADYDALIGRIQDICEDCMSKTEEGQSRPIECFRCAKWLKSCKGRGNENEHELACLHFVERERKEKNNE